MRTITIAAGGLGGGLLLAEALGAPGWVSGVGLALLLVAAMAGGALLVPQAPLWLRVVVALGAGGLGAAVYGVLIDALADDPVHLGVGAACLLLAVMLAARPRPGRRSAGAHAR
ncbi:hypothetical protein NODU109028_12990 [Nocardioides dubius]|uniref:Integral membrane protein n=1 Tax=Nocardioides dubius TaxID=317019 RepID=A0ABP4EHG1_9ACTN